MRRGGFWVALGSIPVAALVVVLPLIVHGCSCGHDFDFHLISWMEAAAQFRAGVWHPAWAFSPAWNAGEPRFVFYPPMSWTLGATLGMVLPWGAVPVVYTWLAIAAAGSAMYGLARRLEGTQAGSRLGALIAAAVYMANPYMIFTAYERTAYAELLAAAWIPLLLGAILRERVTVLPVAIPVALLWLTNAPAAVMGCYALAGLAVVRLVWMWRGSSLRELAGMAARVSGGAALGLGLAAFYIVPAAYERRWVQIAMATVSGMRIGDNFLFHHTGDGLHDEVLYTASMIALGMLLAAATIVGVATVVERRGATRNGSDLAEAGCGAPGGDDARKRTLVSIALLAAVIGVLLTSLSTAVWRIAPEMAFLQFPWRLTAILAAAGCAAIPFAVARLRVRAAVSGVLALVVVGGMSWPAAHAFWQICDDEDNVSARRAVFLAQTGTDPTDEYTTGDADNDSLLHANPPWWVVKHGEGQPEQAAERAPGAVPMHFAIDTNEAEALVLNLREYPAWVVRVNGAEMKRRIERTDGLIAVPVDAGHSRIDLSYAMTKDRMVGDGISLVALCAAIGLAGSARVRRRSRIIGS